MDDLISVIMPIYGAEAFLDKAINSVLEQTYKNLEIILVDDGSPDKCPRICDEYSKIDNRVKVIHKKNGGLSSARNAGIELARGKYIVLFDDDDIMCKDFLLTLYNVCEEYNCDIAQCDFLMTQEDSILLQSPPNNELQIMNPLEVMRDFFSESQMIKYWVVWNKMYRRELFSDIRFPVGKNHEDMFTTYKLLWKSRKTAKLSRYLHYYFQRKESMTGKKASIAERIDVLEALREEAAFLKNIGLSEQYYFMVTKFYCSVFETIDHINDYIGYYENREYYDTVMNDFRIDAIKIKEDLLSLPAEGMLTKIRTIYSSLEDEERKLFLSKYGKRIAESPEIAFVLPSEMVDNGDRIAIYGAGKVGQSYYEQIVEDKKGEVVIWVDNGFKNYIKKGFPVKPIDSLFKIEFDKLIIAIQNRKVALDIRNNLIFWGIDEEKIRYCPPVSVDRGGKMKLEFQADSEKIKYGDHNSRMILINTPDHDNLGDHLLTIGALRFLRDKFPEYTTEEITGRQWDLCKETIIPKITMRDIILIVGGGFMGDLWPVQDNRVKEIINAFPNNKIIFFPQTFFYINQDGVIIDDIQIYNCRRNIYFIHREKKSYDFFIKTVVKDPRRNSCFPDTALYIKYFQTKNKRKNVLVCLRMDKESRNEKNRTELLEIVKNTHKEAILLDTVLDKSVLKSERQIEINNILNIISSSELLITDRLHAMIMALITGTPCIALDNLSGKVSGVYNWIKNVDYVTCVEFDNLSEELVNEYIKKCDNSYDKEIVEKEFDSMRDTIRGWLDERIN